MDGHGVTTEGCFWCRHEAVTSTRATATALAEGCGVRPEYIYPSDGLNKALHEAHWVYTV